MGKRSRDKGKCAEREVVQILRAAWVAERSSARVLHADYTDPANDEHSRLIRRGLQGQGNASGEMVPDVVAPGLWCEVKRRMRVHPGDWIAGMAQAARAAARGRLGQVPCCWYRSDHGPWWVAIAAQDFCEMAGADWPFDDALVHVAGEDFGRCWASWERGL